MASGKILSEKVYSSGNTTDARMFIRYIQDNNTTCHANIQILPTNPVGEEGISVDFMESQIRIFFYNTNGQSTAYHYFPAT